MDDKTIDCGTCCHGRLDSPNMACCDRKWPSKRHRRAFGETCLYWKGRVDGRKYYDYDFDETDPFVLAVEGLIEKLDDAVDRSKRCPDEDIREFFERNMVSFRSWILELKDGRAE
jgi:hypothetical protein